MSLKSFFTSAFRRPIPAVTAQAAHPENQCDFVDRFGTPKKRLKYLFILNSAHSGGRLFYNILDSSPQVQTFIKCGGITIGQGLFLPRPHDLYPERPIMPEYLSNVGNVDYEPPLAAIRETYHKSWPSHGPIFCDRGALYIAHGKAVENYFSNYGDVFFIVQIRNPYNCESLDCQSWVDGAERLRWYATHLNNKVVLRYEDLVTDPASVKEKLVNFLPELAGIQMGTSQSIRLVSCNRYKSLSSLTTKFLDIKDKEGKNKILCDHVDLLEFFGYKYLE